MFILLLSLLLHLFIDSLFTLLVYLYFTHLLHYVYLLIIFLYVYLLITFAFMSLYLLLSIY